MNNQLTTQQQERLTDEISGFLVRANEDLVNAENEERFEDASMIQTAIDLFLCSHSQILATPQTPASVVFTLLREQSQYCFDSIKAKHQTT